MRKKIILVIITTCMVTCDEQTATKSVTNPDTAVSSRQHRLTDDIQFGLSSAPNSSSVYPSTEEETLRHKHRKRRRRCRRQAGNFYRVPNYQPNYNGQNQISPSFLPYGYILPSPYVPARCNSICNPCRLPSCVRRCPGPGFYVPTTRTPPKTRPTSSTRATTRTRPTPSRTTPTTRTTSRTTPTTRPTWTTSTSTPSQTKGMSEAWTTTNTHASTNQLGPLQMLNKNPCFCDPDGSKSSTCNHRTGVCDCKPHYTGDKCTHCQDGYWKRFRKCVGCRCDIYGTLSNTYCDKDTGECHCKSGVTGVSCDACLPDHYGTAKSGCKKCDPCNKKGHFCDPKNGKCVCPSLTTGNSCERCVENSWGYEPSVGCKPCNCSREGSSSPQCDQTRGTCSCRIGYEGVTCTRCSYGYYGYPNCRKCNCDPKGTQETYCRNGLCRCREDGSCICKENVQGKHCDQCKGNNFGLIEENPKGCINCFCFGRSKNCTDALHHWNKISTRVKRSLEDDNQVAEDEMMLPTTFMGDLTSSYGGTLSVNVGGGYFEVFLEGNSVQLRSAGSNGQLRLLESENWRVSSRNPYFPNSCIDSLNRSCYMVVLQKVTSIVVRANKRIRDVTLDKTSAGENNYAVTHTVEKCQCPKEYTGLSCQNPNVGYYRYFPKDRRESWIDPIVGIARKCECGRHSSECDPETGLCKNCKNHTAGNHCEKCAEGFYMDKNKECASCLCPSVDQNNSKSCSPTDSSYKCECKVGYSGNFCENCDIKFYRKPNSKCEPCQCNPSGVLPESSGRCNNLGKCHCKDGFIGDKCYQCVGDREYLKDGHCEPCDECTMKLLDDIDKLNKDVEKVFELFKNGTGPPWRNLTEKIEKLDGLSDKYYDKKERFDTLLEHANLAGYRDKVAQMERKLYGDNIEVENNREKSNRIYENSSKLLEETEELGRDLVNLIGNLEKSGTKKISLAEALERAQSILADIKNASKRFSTYSNSTLLFCRNVTEKVNNLYTPRLDFPENKLKGLKEKLQDLMDIVSYVENLSKKAETKNTENTKRIERLRKQIKLLKSEKENHESTVGDIVKKIEAIEDVMDQLVIVYDDLKNISDSGEFKEMENRVKRQMKQFPEAEELYSKAVQHVKELENKVNQYHSLFNFTKDEWKKINASGAYEAIITSIEGAKESAKQSKKILRNAILLINPKDADSLDMKANLSHVFSVNLKKKLEKLKNISNNLGDLQKKLVKLEYGLLENGKADNNLTQILHKIDNEVTSQHEEVAKIEKASKLMEEVSDNMTSIKKRLEGINVEKLSDLLKEYQDSSELAIPKEIGDLVDNMTETRKKLQNQSILPTTTDNNEKRKNRLDELRNNMKTLQIKIEQAKQHVNAIDVAMGLDNCKMSYRLPSSQYFQSLSITFKCQTCMLFKWSKLNKEVLEISTKNGVATVSVEEKKLDIPYEDAEETTIYLEKVGALLKVQIDDVERSERVPDILVIGIEDRLEIGSLSTSNSPENDSYVTKVFLNKNVFGIWKFFQSNGSCRGLKGNGTVENGKRIFYKGNGYRAYGINRSLDPRNWAFKFHFNTFDDNALIYLAEHKETCAYIALYLKNGRIVFETRHNNGDKKTLENHEKVNDAKTHNVEIATHYETRSSKQSYSLRVDKTNIDDTVHLERKNVFKIKEAEHYLGGVPPSFNRTCVPINTTSLLGILEQTSQKVELTNETSTYGVIAPRKAIYFYHAWLHKNGYIDVDAAFKKIHSISFILRPTSPNGVFMTFHDNSNSDKTNTLAINDLKLVINDKKYDIANFTLNDYNSVEIEMTKKEKEMTINGKSGELEDPGRIVGDWIRIGGTENEFSGGIRDIVINGRSLTFNSTSVKNFSNVEIGREEPLPHLPRSTPSVKSLAVPLNFTNSMQNTERCVEFDEHKILSDAVKLGDSPDSYIRIKTNFWRRNGTLRFDFRSFEPDGLIFMSSNKKMNYITLDLKDGQLRMNIKAGKKKVKSVLLATDELDNGNWHSVKITKRGKRISISIDEKETKNKLRIKLRDEIYFGGVPVSQEYTKLNNSIRRLHPFRGCLKSLMINDEQMFFSKVSKDMIHYDVGQCFSNVEEGAYFSGDSFAVYRDDFQVNKMLELSFEFRTSEQNGVLLSVSNPGDFPAMTIELQNGAVVMAVNTGNGVETNVTNNLDSDFSLCNNRWHNVTVIYSTSELTVIVDGIRKSWVLSNDDSMMDELEAPLYIGGIPGGAPKGTSKTNKNFKGCMKKFRIRTQQLDWSQMKELKNVMLDSCPTDYS